MQQHSVFDLGFVGLCRSPGIRGSLPFSRDPLVRNASYVDKKHVGTCSSWVCASRRVLVGRRVTRVLVVLRVASRPRGSSWAGPSPNRRPRCTRWRTATIPALGLPPNDSRSGRSVLHCEAAGLFLTIGECPPQAAGRFLVFCHPAKIAFRRRNGPGSPNSSFRVWLAWRKAWRSCLAAGSTTSRSPLKVPLANSKSSARYVRVEFERSKE